MAQQFLSDVGSGASHPTQIVRTARALAKKSPKDETYQFFARCAAGSLKNAERDLSRKVKFASGFELEPFYIDIPLRSRATGGPDIVETVATLAPFEVFGQLFTFGAAFQKAILGGNSDCGWFWGEAKQHHLHNDPELFANAKKVVPTFWHSDGAEVYKDVDWTVWSWTSSMVRDVDSRDSKFLVCLVETQRLIPETSCKEITEFIAWNLQVLESGVYPSKDHKGRALSGRRARRAGNEIANGWRATFFGWQGDMKERVKMHRFTRNWQSNFMCERCLATKHLPETTPYDFGSGAAWRKTEVSHRTYVALTPEPQLSPWIAVRGWRLDRCSDDLLHTVWLGVGKDLGGQMLFELAMSEYRAVQPGLDALHKECVAWHRAKGVCVTMRPWSMATLSMTSLQDFPVLETKMKAARAKQVVLWVCDKVVRLGLREGATSFEIRRGRMAGSFVSMVRIMDKGGSS